MPKKYDQAMPARPRVRNDALDLDAIAVQALGFLAADGDRLQRFLALTGIDSGSLRAVAAEPGFSLAILSHLCADEALLVAFAAEAKLDPAALGALVSARTSPDPGVP